MFQDSDINVSRLQAEVRNLCKLYLEAAKFAAVEKTTMLLAGVGVFMLVALLGLVAFVFLMIGLASLLASYIEPFWSYFIVAGVFIVGIAIVLVLRETMIYNPIARFLSRIFLAPPAPGHESANNSPTTSNSIQQQQ